jgi:hypothetical protein
MTIEQTVMLQQHPYMLMKYMSLVHVIPFNVQLVHWKIIPFKYIRDDILVVLLGHDVICGLMWKKSH